MSDRPPILNPGPDATPRAEQTIAQLLERLDERRRAALIAVSVDAVVWHRPPTSSRNAWAEHDRGKHQRPRFVTITSQVNWLRSHYLATLARPASDQSDLSRRRVVLTARGRELLAAQSLLAP